FFFKKKKKKKKNRERFFGLWRVLDSLNLEKVFETNFTLLPCHSSDMEVSNNNSIRVVELSASAEGCNYEINSFCLSSDDGSSWETTCPLIIQNPNFAIINIASNTLDSSESQSNHSREKQKVDAPEPNKKMHLDEYTIVFSFAISNVHRVTTPFSLLALPDRLFNKINSSLSTQKKKKKRKIFFGGGGGGDLSHVQQKSKTSQILASYNSKSLEGSPLCGDTSRSATRDSKLSPCRAQEQSESAVPNVASIWVDEKKNIWVCDENTNKRLTNGDQCIVITANLSAKELVIYWNGEIIASGNIFSF
ncbi:hypothetical protein RFI_07688, partial [Reticulomyxa filosa]